MEGSSVFGPGVGGADSSTMEAQVASGEVVDGFTHAGTTVVSQLRSGQVLQQLPDMKEQRWKSRRGTQTRRTSGSRLKTTTPGLLF